METNREELWEQQLAFIKQLKQKSAKHLFQSTPNLETAFQPQHTLCCIDGGIKEGVHKAGSGVLGDMDILKQFVTDMGVTEFTTHDGCGAFAKAFPDVKEHDTEAEMWGKMVAASLGLGFRHIKIDTMDRPHDFHNEVVVYYDATGQFNRINGMPTGFVVTRHDRETAQADLDLAIQIAFGPHGFGDKFGFQTPLHIIPIAHPTDNGLSLKVLEDEVREVTAKHELGRTAISGYKTAWVLRAQA